MRLALAFVIITLGCGSRDTTPDAGPAPDAAPATDAAADAADAAIDAPGPDAMLAACPCGGQWIPDKATGELTCATLNACGGCEALPAAPGDGCGAGHYYYCYAPDLMSCSTAIPTNACGWSGGPLAHEPGTPCGGSSLCRYVCDISMAVSDTVCRCE